jgi:hypothetical protein
MARKISALTRAQIEEAVKLGGWPDSVGQLLVEKLIARRNQIVKAFEIDREGAAMIPFNAKLTTADGMVVNGELKVARAEGYPTPFAMTGQDFKVNVLRPLEMYLIQLGQGLLGENSKYAVDPVSIGLDSGIVSNVLLQIKREIEKNPAPTSENDAFIVKDTLRIGFELGTGLVVGARTEMVHSYHLIHTAKNREQALTSRNFFKNLFLPLEKWDGQFPSNSVLVSELSLEGGGFIKTPDSPALISIGLQMNGSKIILSRSIISSREKGKLRFYEDDSVYNEVSAKLYAKLLIMKIPMFVARSSHGKIERLVYELDSDRVTQDGTLSRLVKAAIRNGKIEELRGYARTQKISSKFSERLKRASLFGIMGGRQLRRTDLIERTDLTDAETAQSEFNIQVLNARTKSWALFDNSEEFMTRVFLVSEPNGTPDVVKNPAMVLTYTINDTQTRSSELGTKYLAFANAAVGTKLVSFTPNLHSINGRWGDTVTFVNVIHSPEVVRMLLDSKALPLAELKASTDKEFKKDKAARDRSSDFSRMLARARSEKSPSKQMVLLNQAMAKLVWKDNGTLHGRVLGQLNYEIRKRLGPDAVYAKIMVANSSSEQNIFPGGVPLIGEMGARPNMTDPISLMMDMSPVELYESL